MLNIFDYTSCEHCKHYGLYSWRDCGEDEECRYGDFGATKICDKLREAAIHMLTSLSMDDAVLYSTDVVYKGTRMTLDEFIKELI